MHLTDPNKLKTAVFIQIKGDSKNNNRIAMFER